MLVTVLAVALGFAGGGALAQGPSTQAPRRDPPRPEAGPGDAVDAELLRDLDLLSSPDYTREREVSRRLRMLERLRFWESLPLLEGSGAGRPPASNPGGVERR